MLRTTQNSF